MLYVIAKIVEGVLEPGTLLLILLAFGIWRMMHSRQRTGLRLVTFVLFAYTAIAIVPISDLPLVPLENRFPVLRTLPNRVDGIILLGGAVDPERTAEYGQVALNDAAARVTETVRLARQYPGARIVVSSGVGTPITEAAATARLLVELGVPVNRVILEDRSRTTHQDAIYSKQIVDPQPDQVWMLVTSAYHMPRAVGCFRRIGWPVVPDPVDFEASRSLRFSLAEGLAAVSTAEHEWFGLVGYYIAGWTSALLPGP